ncbi:hypothetical protein cand_029920 [Cryptosporidium andersoni]|uniref:Oocyst wall protein n=1 Tax=Cryptosporidium andersoni TaxID=117008 RepID=A0A1J4MQN4_9CRYT|nr:hypothetical protein cand_029920 [Cryptosporidium andersoni]
MHLISFHQAQHNQRIRNILKHSTILIFLVTYLFKNEHIFAEGQYVRVPMESCPNHFILENGVCSHYIEAQKVPKCPVGFVSQEDECYTVEPLIKECSSGFLMQDKQCVKETIVEKRISCPEHTSYDSKTQKCIYKEVFEASCPQRSFEFKGKCVISKDPIKICPDNSVFDIKTSMCLTRITTPPLYNCPNSYIYNSETHECIRQVETQKVCPDKYQEIDNLYCGIWLKPKYTCPINEDYEFHEEEMHCKIIKYQNSTLICPIGTYFDGYNCISEKQVHERVCPSGYTEGDNYCISSSDAILNCPEGFNISIHNGVKVCSQIFTVDPDYFCPVVDSIFDYPSGMCKKETILPKICPGDSQLTSNMTCTRKIKQLWNCPPGTEYDSYSHMCIENIHSDPIFICPKGTILDESESLCIGYSQNILVCPPGYDELEGNICAHLVAAQRSCPEGLNFTNNYCEETIINKADLICPDGGKLKDSVCIYSNIQEPEKCPPGSFDSGNNCLISEPPIRYCIEGYEVDPRTEKCKISSKRPADTFCEQPAFMNMNGNCVWTEISPRVCPPEYVEDHKNPHFCKKEISATLECPEGYQLISKKCIREILSDKVLACPDGYQISEADEQCHKIGKNDPICPTGFLDGGDECFRTLKPKSQCKNSLAREQKSGDCIKIDVSEPSLKCPVGTTIRNSECILMKQLPLQYTCPIGKRVGDSCFEEVILDAQYSCPNGSELNAAKRCQKLVEYDCSEVSVVNGLCHGNLNLQHGILSYDKVPTSSTCSQVVRTPKTCIRTEAFQPQISCPEGSITMGKHCIKKKYYPMQKECSDPSRKIDECYSEEILQKIPTCPDGSSTTSDGKCALVHREPPSLACLEEYQMDGGICIQKVPKLCPENGCYVHDTIQPIQECPIGYEDIDGSCIFRSSIEPIFHCKVGVLTNPTRGICHDKIAKGCIGNCEVVHHDFPKFKCNKDEILDSNTKECILNQYGPHKLKCNGPFKLVGDQCIHYTSKVCSSENCSVSTVIPARYRCTNGNLLPNGICETYKVTPHQLTCPENYDLHGDNCMQLTKKICLNNKCEKKIVYSPKVECPPYYELKSGKCIRKVSHLPQTTCPEGSTAYKSHCIINVEAECPTKGCILVDLFEPESKCPNGFLKKTESLNVTCYKNLYNLGFLSCSKGSTLSGNQCTIYKEKACPEDNCSRISQYPPEYVCPPGSELVNTFCKSSHIVLPELHCPNEYILVGDQCMKKVEKICPPSGCYHQTVIDAEITCPSGYNFLDNTCVRNKFTTPTNKCSEGTNYIDGKCLVFYPKECPEGYCEKVIEIDPSKSCPTGFVDLGNTCQKIDYAAHKHLCPKGTQHRKNHCLRYIKPEYTCPNGFVEENEKCLKVVKTDVMVSFETHCVGYNCSSYNNNRTKVHKKNH